MYQVLEDGKPCDSKNFDNPIGMGWDNSVFNTLDEAISYAKSWWGRFYYEHKITEPGIYPMIGSVCEIKVIENGKHT